jgi:hypothetical protein
MAQKSSNSWIKRVVLFLGMIIGTGLCGLLVGIIASFIGATVLDDGTAGFGRLVGVLAGMVIGYLIGVIVGILIINKLLHYSGSLRFGFIGALLGWIAVIGLSRAFEVLNDTNLVFVSILIAPPLFGTIGFHVTSLLKR